MFVKRTIGTRIEITLNFRYWQLPYLKPYFHRLIYVHIYIYAGWNSGRWNFKKMNFIYWLCNVASYFSSYVYQVGRYDNEGKKK